MYKWVDDEGNVHYSQNPPMDRDVETIKAPKTPGASTSEGATGAESTPGSQQQEGTPPGESAPAQKQTAQMDPKAMQAACEKARSRLQTLTTHPRIRLQEGDSYRIIGEEERQAMIQEANDQISEYCK